MFILLFSGLLLFVSRLIMTPLGTSHTPLQHHAWRRAALLSWPSEWPKGNSRWAPKTKMADGDWSDVERSNSIYRILVLLQNHRSPHERQHKTTHKHQNKEMSGWWRASAAMLLYKRISTYTPIMLFFWEIKSYCHIRIDLLWCFLNRSDWHISLEMHLA